MAALTLLLLLCGCQTSPFRQEQVASRPSRDCQAKSLRPAEVVDTASAAALGPNTGTFMRTTRMCVRDACKRGGWEFVVAPYAWLASTTGTVWADGQSEDIDVPFDEVLDATNAGFQLHAEVRYRRFFLSLDATIAQLGDEFRILNTTIDVEIDQLILEVLGGYRLFGPEFGTARSNPSAACLRRPALDVFAGVRYWRTDTTIQRDSAGLPPIIPPSSASFEDREDWVDLIFGARFTWRFARRFSVSLEGDYGGFGIGDSAQSTWKMQGLVSWHFARQWALTLGWRAINVDRVEGSGTDRNGLDTTQNGPLIGVVFGF